MRLKTHHPKTGKLLDDVPFTLSGGIHLPTPRYWIAFNHNGIALCQPTLDKNAAQREAAEYTYATGNPSFIDHQTSGQLAPEVTP